jgi:hypothetical protein
VGPRLDLLSQVLPQGLNVGLLSWDRRRVLRSRTVGRESDVSLTMERVQYPLKRPAQALTSHYRESGGVDLSFESPSDTGLVSRDTPDACLRTVIGGH